MVPVDATFPIQRISYMLSDANAAAIITTDAHVARLQELDSDIPVHSVSSEGLHQTPCNFKVSQEQIRNPTDEAYIVYTSGSTGKPKGVPVFHEGAVNAMMSSLSNAGFVEGARVMQFMAIGFDVCLWEIWKTLSMGATLVFRTEDLSKKIGTVDVLMCTPTALSLLGDPSAYPSLKTIFVGGEAIPSALKDIWCPFANVYNCYGPSECSITTHFGELTVNTRVDLGKPIENSTCYILDNAQRPVPIGVVGEMCLGGIGVCRGYINLPDQSAERFIADPFRAGGRMYRSGDLGRLLPNGRFEILGRQDTQVKLKGYRIELDEVAEAMMQHPGVIAAAALVKDKTHLVGYYSPASVDTQSLRETVATLLPVYMVPAVWVGLDNMPQNTNGKIDKKALEAMEVAIEVETLVSETEQRMAQVWAQVLNVDVSTIGRNTSFFALGGDSITVIKVVAACKNAGLAITASQLLKEAELSRVASCVADHVGSSWPTVSLSADIVQSVQDEWATPLQLQDFIVYPVTPLQAGMILATVNNREAYIAQNTFKIAAHVDNDMLCRAFETLVKASDILRTSFVTTPSGIYQVIRPDIQDMVVAQVEVASIEDFLREDFVRGFEIGDKYFVRLTIAASGSDRFGVLTIHHALYDGWAISMLLSDLYDVLCGKSLANRPSFQRVVDYIEAQDKVATENYWRAYMDGITSTPLGSTNSVASPREEPLAVQSTLSMAELAKAAQRVGITVAELTRLAWAATLRKYTRQNDVVFGQVMANRDIPVKDADRIIGPLLNTVPCRFKFDDSLSTQSLIQLLQNERSSKLAHAHSSLIDIKKWSQVEGDLFDTMFSFQNLPDDEPESAHGPIEMVDLSSHSIMHAVHHTFELIIQPSATTLVANALYKPSAISWTQAQLILDEFNHTLGQLCNALESNAHQSDLWALSPAQEEMLQVASFGTEVALPFELLHHGFESQAAMQPHARAIEFEDQWLSYGELNQQANVVAHDLAALGVCVGSRVTVIMGRCLEFSIGLVATLKAGAAVMPLDASFPAQRLAFVLTDAN
ncbi:hypothetical protein As57867_005003, partial [Aphanomyces stellatus]